MEHGFAKLAAAVAPFHHLDFSVWFGFAGGLRPLALALLVGAGLFAALAGTRHPFERASAALVGLLFGALVAPDLQALLDTFSHVSPKLVGIGLPAALALLGVFVPTGVVFVIAGAMGAVIGVAFVSEKEMFLGLVPGFLVAGAVGSLFGRYLATLFTAWVGSVLVVGSLLALVADHALGKLLTSSEYVPLGLALALTIAGAALQFATYQDEDARRDRKANAREKKQLDKEAREREARFATYRR